MMIKKLTVDDLLHNIALNRSPKPEYMLWLGAGASVSSQVPTASGIVTDLLKIVHNKSIKTTGEAAFTSSSEELRNWATSNISWFDPDDFNRSEYAQVMENVYTVRNSRERYIKNLMRNKTPSIGYKYLGGLIAKGVFDTVITTNFDPLIRTACDPLLPLPLTEVNSLEQYSAVKPLPDEPQLIRLHGDFWHGNILNTEGELENTPQIRYDAVQRLLQSYGLIVIGYGGSDRGIMNSLFNEIAENPNLGTSGIFWCHRRGDKLSSRVVQFLERAVGERTYLVEFEDFDKLMTTIGEYCKVQIPTEGKLEDEIEQLKRERDELYEELESAWDWQAYLSQFINLMLMDATRQEQLSNLSELNVFLNSTNALLFDFTTLSVWRVSCNAPPSYHTNQKIGPVIGSQLSKIRAAIKLDSSNQLLQYNVFEGFSDDMYIEVFPVWRGDFLVGFIAFNSEQSIIENCETKLVRAAAQLLVNAFT